MDDTTGIIFNGQPLEQATHRGDPQRRSYAGKVTLPGVKDGSDSETYVFWENYCTCQHVDAAGGCLDHEYVLVFEIPKMGTNSHPGFTLSYKQYGPPQILRLSGFPDRMGLFDFGKSDHWKSPLLSPSRYHGTIDGHDEATTASAAPMTSPATPSKELFTSEVLPTPTQGQSSATPVLDHHDVQSPLIGQLSYESAVTSAPHLKVQGHARLSPSFKLGLEYFEDKAKHAAQAVADHLSNLEICHAHSHKEQPPSNGPPTSKPPSFSNPTDCHEPWTCHSDPSTHLIDTSSIGSNPEAITRNIRTDQALRAFKITSVIIVVVSMSGLAFALAQRDPRRRAERAARCEERRNKRLFRAAVRRQRWANFVARLRGSSASRSPASASSHTSGDGIDWATWQEKRDHGGRRGSVREGLCAMRKAHGLVDGLVSAEEGRCRGAGAASGKASFGFGIRGPSAAATAETRGRSFSDVRSEKSLPPPYDEEDGGFVGVADGMRYTPSGTEVTPASSVIDTSTRASAADSDSEAEKE